MHKLTLAAAIGLALAFGTAHAASHAGDKHDDAKHEEGKHTQANRMKTCSADAKAKGLKGDERKAFMSDCLRKKA
ncbi:PsiF family protein [Ramlibacter humi]|uniref:Phosphate starvation-inducible protein PsiF n=1 Tax=Ramlibacter humi TaxID=2530451 RepID=A0A4Z0BR10_9BURK|nr:PsiF family protein [Ramlibacter humi]TFZ01743.1 phosphate starvation-inducible protein PsiF [Ramlibacter humi]